MEPIYPFNDGVGMVALVSSTKLHNTHLSEDYMPVLAARVSYGGDDKTGENEENDVKLMKFLAKHNHNTPFEHQFVTFKVVCPIFVAREWHRHRTQSYNEISMRYSSSPVGKIWMPETFRKSHKTNKQSSEGSLSEEEAKTAKAVMIAAHRKAIQSYNILLDLGVAKEIARAVVPVANYTEFYASANLRNWAAFCALRIPEDAQYEIRVYAKAIDQFLGDLYPKSWGVLRECLTS